MRLYITLSLKQHFVPRLIMKHLTAVGQTHISLFQMANYACDEKSSNKVSQSWRQMLRTTAWWRL